SHFPRYRLLDNWTACGEYDTRHACAGSSPAFRRSTTVPLRNIAVSVRYRRMSIVLFAGILSAMTTAEVANKYVALCRAGKYMEALETLYSADVVSVEAMEFGGMQREIHGKDAVRGKNNSWFETNEVHSASVTGPFSSPERFAVVFSFDWT